MVARTRFPLRGAQANRAGDIGRAGDRWHRRRDDACPGDRANEDRAGEVIGDVRLRQERCGDPVLQGRARDDRPDAIGDVRGIGSVDRILETIEKFEEDLTDHSRVHGKMKVILQVAPAIEDSAERDRKAPIDPLMLQIQQSLQGMMDQLALESPLLDEQTAAAIFPVRQQ